MQRLLLLLLKGGISILLLALALRSVHSSPVLARLASVRLGWMLAAVLLTAVQVGLLALRWRRIATMVIDRLTLPAALQISFIGTFFSQVLPSTIGGDAARIWLLARRGSGWAAAAYSVLIDRIVGVAALAAIVLCCLPWSLTLLKEPLAQAALIVIGCGAIGASALFVLLGATRLPLLGRLAVGRHLVAASRIAWGLCRRPEAALRVAACSFAIHALTVASAFACARAVAAPIGVLDLLFLLPPVMLVATVPISIAGWGVRETSMVLAFGYAGLAQGDGLLLSVLLGLTGFAVGAAGGIVWIVSGVKTLGLRRPEVSALLVKEG